MQEAAFAGGCFWCIESYLKTLPGTEKVVSGYMGGGPEDANYEDVSSGTTEHFETVHLLFDEGQISYRDLVRAFFSHIDPTDATGQFCDRGTQYLSAIFYYTDDQRAIAEKVRLDLGESGAFEKPIVTEILPAKEFYVAEEYHQGYSEKCPIPYRQYATASGRAAYVSNPRTHGKTPGGVLVSDREKQSKLDQLEYAVTQQSATERPFSHAYSPLDADGIYVDIITGKPLFSSKDKFDAGCGWPSFSKPIEDSEVSEHPDTSLARMRTEVRSATSDSHLGHVFEDGPAELTGLRYCINGAAIRFIPKEKFIEYGYEEYLSLFE